MRRAPLPSRRERPRRGPARDPEYLAWVRTQSCCARSAREGEECRGRVQVHHAGPRGLGQRCSDREAIPLCARHHREWHDCRGRFAGMSKELRAAFAAAAIEMTQQDHAAQGAFLATEAPLCSF